MRSEHSASQWRQRRMASSTSVRSVRSPRNTSRPPALTRSRPMTRGRAGNADRRSCIPLRVRPPGTPF